MTNPTPDQLTQHGAEAMGWKTQLRYSYSIGAHVETWVNKESEIMMETKDFSPCTKIEQAMGIAFKMNMSVSFDPDDEGLMLSVMKNDAEPGKMFILNEWISKDSSLPDCAHQIMLTLWEVENGN